MIVIALSLYFLGALMMMCLADLELRSTPHHGGKPLAIFVASVLWPAVMLYTVVATSVDLTVALMRRLFSPTE